MTACKHLPTLSEPSLTLCCAKCGSWLKCTGSVLSWACSQEGCAWEGPKPDGGTPSDPDPWCPDCGGAAYEDVLLCIEVPRAQATRGAGVCLECDIDQRECEHAEAV